MTSKTLNKSNFFWAKRLQQPKGVSIGTKYDYACQISFENKRKNFSGVIREWSIGERIERSCSKHSWGPLKAGNYTREVQGVCRDHLSPAESFCSLNPTVCRTNRSQQSCRSPGILWIWPRPLRDLLCVCVFMWRNCRNGNLFSFFLPFSFEFTDKKREIQTIEGGIKAFQWDGREGY